MIRALGASLVVASVAHAAHAAHAEPAPSEPDPAVADAANGNLEPTGRHGIRLSGTLLPSTVVGTGSRGDVGLGAMVSFRLGKVASSTTTMLVEVEAGGIVHQPPGQGTATNSLGAVLVGAIHYVAPSLWLRIGFGWGNYVRNDENVDGKPVPHESLGGPIGVVGIGIDLVRWRYATLGLEASSSLLLHRHGTTSMSGLGLGLTF